MKKILLTTALAGFFVAGCQTTSAVNEEISPQLRQAIYSFTKEEVDFKAAAIDLNNDGIQDSVVLLDGDNWCGSEGCTLLIFEGLDNGEYRFASESIVASAPIYVLETTSQGWSDLSVYTNGQGQVTMKWGGKNYPSTPSLQPTLKIDSRAATPIIPREIP